MPCFYAPAESRDHGSAARRQIANACGGRIPFSKHLLKNGCCGAVIWLGEFLCRFEAPLPPRLVRPQVRVPPPGAAVNKSYKVDSARPRANPAGAPGRLVRGARCRAAGTHVVLHAARAHDSPTNGPPKLTIAAPRVFGDRPLCGGCSPTNQKSLLGHPRRSATLEQIGR